MLRFELCQITGSSSGWIILAHTSQYLFFLLTNCAYNSHIIKNEIFLGYFMRILVSCAVYKFETVI